MTLLWVLLGLTMASGEEQREFAWKAEDLPELAENKLLYGVAVIPERDAKGHAKEAIQDVWFFSIVTSSFYFEPDPESPTRGTYSGLLDVPVKELAAFDWHAGKEEGFAAGKFEFQDEVKEGVLLFSAEKSWEARFMELPLFETARWIEKEGKPKVGIYRRAESAAAPSLELLDPDTGVRQPAPLEDWALVYSQERLRVGDMLSFTRAGLESVSLPVTPPPEMLQQSSLLEIVRNDADRLVLWRVRPTAADEKTHFFIYDKAAKTWSEQSLKGDRSVPKMLGQSFLCAHEAWDYPEADKYGPQLTDAWDGIDLSSGAIQQPFVYCADCCDTDVLISTKRYDIIRISEKIRYKKTDKKPFMSLDPESVFRYDDLPPMVRDEVMKDVRLLYWGAKRPGAEEAEITLVTAPSSTSAGEPAGKREK